MRHIFWVPAPGPVAALAFGMTVPASSGVLITPSGRTYRLASSELRTPGFAVLLSAVTSRADPHLALASGTQIEPGIVHDTLRAKERWTTHKNTAILTKEPYNRADLGAAPDVDRQVLRSGVASVSSPPPI